MFSSQTCNLVLKTNTTNKEGEIFVLYMGKFFKIINRMIQLAEQIVNSVSTVSATVKKILASQKNTKPIILPKIIIVKVQRYGYEINL
jgi:FlaA1/EpsC-like NDP-sugar epimerase